MGEASKGPREGRIVAVGDVHGGHKEFIEILQSAGLVDSSGGWIGGRATLVQTGDLLDRGPDDRGVMDFLMRLEKEAKRHHGKVISLLGNHEVMNIMGDLRYVSLEAYEGFVDKGSEKRRQRAFKTYTRFLKRRAWRLGQSEPLVSKETKQDWMRSHPPGYLEHRAAFDAKGKYGRWLRKKKTIARLGKLVFVHGGLHPDLSFDIESINKRIRRELRAFDQYREYMVEEQLILPFFDLDEMTEAATAEVDRAGRDPSAPERLSKDQRQRIQILEPFLDYGSWLSVHPAGPLWFRGFAQWSQVMGPPLLDRLLETDGVRHFVVGHTPQLERGIQMRFGGKIFLIDTGMLSSYYRGGQPSALEIQGGRFTAIYRDHQEVLLDLSREVEAVTREDG